MMDKQGDDWNNYGALDEENTESAHAKMNNVSRLFGASRGPNRKKMTINKLLLTSNSILTQGIADLRKGTKSKRKPPEESQRRRKRKVNEDSDTEDEEEDGEEIQTGPRDYEETMNTNVLLRVPSDFEHEDEAMAKSLQFMDTKINLCTECTMRRVFVGVDALRIHKQECHDKCSLVSMTQSTEKLHRDNSIVEDCRAEDL